MALETATILQELVPANPPGSDPILQGDDHIRLIKTVLDATFPNADKAFYFPDSATKSADYTVVLADMNKVFLGNTAGGAFSFTLPTLAAGDDGWTAVFFKNDSSANAMTIVGTINGASNLVMKTQYLGVVIRWTGTAWIGTFYATQGDLVHHAHTVGGTADAITATFAPVFKAYVTNMRFRFTAGGANTVTNPTVNVDGLGAKTIKKLDNSALAAGDIRGAGHVCDCVYNGTDVILLNPTQTVLFGKQKLDIPAAAMRTRTTNGASFGVVELATNKIMVATWDFDTTTQEFVQAVVSMPSTWNEGTLTFVPRWCHSGGANFGVVWAMEGLAVRDDDAMDAAFGSAVTSTDTGGTTHDFYRGPESAACTLGGTPATNCTVILQFKRVPADGSDTLTVDAKLLGCDVYWQSDAATEV